MDRLAQTLVHQDGVITRRQAIDCGVSEASLRTKLRRREWVRVHEGVYLTHTGTPTWHQRAWAAVLGLPRAALSHQSALAAVGLRARAAAGPIHLAVGRKRFAPRRDGVVVHRYSALDDRVSWNARPPRVRVEHAVLDVAAESSAELDVVACLSDAVGARVTTAVRLGAALSTRERFKYRAFVARVLADIADGSCSVLERGYLTRVERAHGLPKPRRQAPTIVGRRGFRDVEYDRWGLVVELDGRFAHDDARSRDRDMGNAVACENCTVPRSVTI
ncbi:type IV toxin-antitoxin system AbiEi family antitoxin domain-containing protein [Gordonia crocea]|uniref:Type IV toxin-antitoxin system AbiEi family antitoxin domain-containing protein n=1 Tax=Gordonia crocea TaxID=589162 RepID=A0A7M3SV35_9ACTN|nr:type IV toxin-antitoxin system AbiEi family antitoxin domain-containing protein [Gordonia crocea]GED96509.1 hypothetical protein nbrc107697_05480 [Gordonia crocea]